VETGTDVTVHYDPLLAKLIVVGETRDEAIARARRALDEFVVLGVRTNITFLRNVMTSDAFVAGTVHTRWTDDAIESLTAAPSDELLAAAAQAAREAPADVLTTGGRAVTPDPWASLSGWRA